MDQSSFTTTWVQKSWPIAGLMALALAIAGCVHTSDVFEMEPKSISKQLALPTCRVSVPLSESEVVDRLRRFDNIENPETYPDWIAITSGYRSGDQIRMLSCTTRCLYSYALIRNNKVLSEFCPVLF